MDSVWPNLLNQVTIGIPTTLPFKNTRPEG